ncbi:MAG TPA: DUF5686 family protein, partial [Phnomibacter sp.]|nr:DUF5686 family protein [Phnomibacter sp.]
MSLTRTIKVFIYSILVTLSFSLSVEAFSQTINGTVTDEQGKPLAYASVYVKGGTQGTTTNNDGKYQLDLSPGTYTIVCAFIGYTRVERQVSLGRLEGRMLDITLEPMQVELSEVVVRAGAEDPAIAIMRKAIALRKQHLEEVSEVRSLVYMKGLIRSLKVPKKVLGQKLTMNNDIVDSSGKGIL